MLSKNKIKFINRLKKKKERNEKKLFLAEGEKIVNEMIHSSLETATLVAEEKFINTLTKHELNKIDEIIPVKSNELQHISSLKTPNKALAVIKQPLFSINTSEIRNSLTLGIDAINDPGNLGTIVRIADWFGIYNIFCSEDTVDVYNPKSVQATMGAISRVKIHYINLQKIIEQLREDKNFNIYGCFLEGSNIYKENLSPYGLIILGSESHGVSEPVSKLVYNKLYIPNFSTNKHISSESLNVSIATGIVCSEFRRRNLED
ncbi:MAG: RNA methyltransferase [Bacteroidales bacterium]